MGTDRQDRIGPDKMGLDRICKELSGRTGTEQSGPEQTRGERERTEWNGWTGL